MSAAILLLVSAKLQAQHQHAANEPAMAAARTSVAPTIDGRDDDAAWRAAPLLRDFRTFAPVEGHEPRFRTEARITYDDRMLYVLVRAFDPDPSAIERRLARRDTFDPTADQVLLFLDPYHDRRSGYEFIVTSAGVKQDAALANDDGEDFSWDGVWDAAARVDSLGWVAEFAIPFGQLRFTDRSAPTFGVMIGRWVGRTGERASTPQYSRARSGVVSQFGDLTGIRDLAAAPGLEMIPYALERSHNIEQRARLANEMSLGGDVRWTPRPTLTLGLTLNPDFGEVEADPALLNLTGVEVRQNERRPFFLEGAGLFARPLAGDGVDQLFYSRRIGRRPSLMDSFGAPDSPGESTILGAARMTARLAPATSLAVLGAESAAEWGATRPTGGRYLIEPSARFGVASVQHDFRAGRSGLGLMLTHVNHDVADSIVAAALPSSADAVALSTRHQTADGAYQASAWVVGSDVRGGTGAIERLQLLPVHAFQQPGGGEQFDSTRTRLAGTDASVLFEKLSGVLRLDASYRRTSPGFDVNELGFLQRAGLQVVSSTVKAKFTSPGSFAGLHYRSAEALAGFTGIWSAATGRPEDRSPLLHALVELPNLAVVHLMTSAQTAASYCTIRCTRGGPALLSAPARFAMAEFTGDPRAVVVPHLLLTRTRGQQRRVEAQADAAWRIRSNLKLSLAAYASNGDDAAAFYQRFGDARRDTAWYAVARLQDYTRSLTPRLDYTLTQTLTLQWYAQAYVSRGTYSDVRRINDAGGRDESQRFAAIADSSIVAHPNGLDYKQFRSNAVLRWEYRPGSSLVVVWSQGRDMDEATPGTIGVWPGQDLRDLFTRAPHNTVAVKLSYWLAR
ncbi:MAG: DUF5916 domain-containing protein [Gemmatimonadaceae bacterium]